MQRALRQGEKSWGDQTGSQLCLGGSKKTEKRKKIIKKSPRLHHHLSAAGFFWLHTQHLQCLQPGFFSGTWGENMLECYFFKKKKKSIQRVLGGFVHENSTVIKGRIRWIGRQKNKEECSWEGAARSSWSHGFYGLEISENHYYYHCLVSRL